MVAFVANNHPVGLPCLQIRGAMQQQQQQHCTYSSILRNGAGTVHAARVHAVVFGVVPAGRISSVWPLRVKCDSDCCANHETDTQHGSGDCCISSTCSGATSGSQSSASLTRAMGVIRPATSVQVLRQVRNRPSNSPLSAFFLMVTALVSMLAAARAAIVRRAYSCKKCRGYGIERCDLCSGAGVVDWEGKYSHVNAPCPKCFGARYTRCGGCGGLYCRPIFAHKRTKQYSVIRDILEFRPRGASG